MKIVRSSTVLINSVQIAKQEALIGFGSDVVYFEKFIENPRHIEVQVVGDGRGNLSSTLGS
jgi:Pyruvate carboxylase